MNSIQLENKLEELQIKYLNLKESIKSIKKQLSGKTNTDTMKHFNETLKNKKVEPNTTIQRKLKGPLIIKGCSSFPNIYEIGTGKQSSKICQKGYGNPYNSIYNFL